jgi:predicted dehydrogenase
MEPVKTALIGLGYWGPNLLRTFSADPSCALEIACDLSDANIEKARRQYPTVRYVKDAKQVFEDPSIELVLIATPTSTHFDLASRALQAGKHVFVEKPMTHSAEEGRMLVELAKRMGKLLMVDHTFVFSPAVEKLTEIVRGGTLGELLYFDSSRLNLGLIQRDTNVLYDLAIHDLSILGTIIDLAGVTKVTALGAKHYGQQEEHVDLHLEHASGLYAHIQVSWLSPVKTRRSVLGGRKGMAVYDDTEPSEKIRIYDRGVDHDTSKPDPFFPKYRSGDILVPALPNVEPLAVEVAHVLRCARGLESPRVSGEHALCIIELLSLADQSLKTGQSLLTPWNKQTFNVSHRMSASAEMSSSATS